MKVRVVESRDEFIEGDRINGFHFVQVPQSLGGGRCSAK